MIKCEIPALPVRRIPCDAVTVAKSSKQCTFFAVWCLEFPEESVHLCTIHNRQLDKEDGNVMLHDGRNLWIWDKDEYRLSNKAVAS